MESTPEPQARCGTRDAHGHLCCLQDGHGGTHSNVLPSDAEPWCTEANADGNVCRYRRGHPGEHRPLQIDVRGPEGPLQGKFVFAWASVALLFVALVVPVAQAPIVGTINVFGVQDGTPYWFLGFAILAGIATFFKRYRLLMFAGVLVIGTTLFYVYTLERAKADLIKSMEGNMFSGLASGLASTVHLQWGISLLVISGVALIVAGRLRTDAPTIPQLFATNRTQFVEGGIGVGVLFLGIAILPIFIPHVAANSAGPQSVIQNPFAVTEHGDATPGPDPKVISMRQAVSVGILEKGFHDKDIYNGDFDDDFAVTTQYHNLTGKAITGIKGSLEFYDQFGDRILGFNIEYEKDLAPHATIAVQEYYKYNQFQESDQKLKSLPLSRLKTIWTPQQINFADGSSISARSE